MKVKNLFLIIVGLTIIISSCGQSITGNAKLKTETDTLSYALGVDVANSLKQFKLEELNYEAFVNGLEASFEDKGLKINEDESKAFLNKYFQKLQQKQREIQEKKNQQNLEDGVAFLEKNKEKDGITTTESGLQYEIIKEGTGISPLPTDTVVVHYHGTLIDGTVFDSSVERGEPAEFPLNRVIKGWTEGLQLMKKGAKYKLYLPTELAYGKNPHPGGKVEPNMVLIFEVELLDVKKGPDHK